VGEWNTLAAKSIFLMPITQTFSRLDSLACSLCNSPYDPHMLQTMASCDACSAQPLLAQYSLPKDSHPSDIVEQHTRSMWRYHALLPVLNPANIVTLGEGWTPLLPLEILGHRLGMDNLFIKDESLNPTGSFKARGLSCAISKAKELGVSHCIIPTAGNAGGAMAAYCARAGMQATVVMPRHTPDAFKQECEWLGAELMLVDGLISDCGARVRELNADGRYFDVSTMREPYRLEGKKTLAYELAEQLGYTLPDVILYPTGGGTGLLGMWKAFHEMHHMGWIPKKFPRMIAVQSENCQPIVQSIVDPAGASSHRGGATLANGLAVPSPFARRMILDVIRESQGTACAVTENALKKGVHAIAALEGLLIAPEGGALVAALQQLLEKEVIQPHEKVVLLNTGSAYKYFSNL
jgi:threonine synthase